jgi:hypothetical protein
MLNYLVSLSLLTISAVQAASTPTVTPSSGAAQDPKAPITLTGCVNRTGATPASFTFADASTGAKYRLSGISVRKYVGQRVVIIGGPERRLTIRGGLVPSANAAAQAGAQDPVQAAIAGLPGGSNSGTGSVALPTFRVTRLRALGGSCE